MTNDFAKGWLQGYFDADGCVIFTPVKNKKQWRGYIQATSINDSILSQAEKCLNHLSIKYRRSKWFTKRPKNRKPICHITIESHKGISEFFNKVGFSCNYKQAKLKEVLAYKNRPDAPKRLIAPSKKQLQDLYWRHKLDTSQIAERFGYKGNVFIYHLMKRHGIPFRSKSEVLKLVWKNKRKHK